MPLATLKASSWLPAAAGIQRMGLEGDVGRKRNTGQAIREVLIAAGQTLACVEAEAEESTREPRIGVLES